MESIKSTTSAQSPLEGQPDQHRPMSPPASLDGVRITAQVPEAPKRSSWLSQFWGQPNRNQEAPKSFYERGAEALSEIEILRKKKVVIKETISKIVNLHNRATENLNEIEEAIQKTDVLIREELEVLTALNKNLETETKREEKVFLKRKTLVLKRVQTLLELEQSYYSVAKTKYQEAFNVTTATEESLSTDQSLINKESRELQTHLDNVYKGFDNLFASANLALATAKLYGGIHFYLNSRIVFLRERRPDDPDLTFRNIAKIIENAQLIENEIKKVMLDPNSDPYKSKQLTELATTSAEELVNDSSNPPLSMDSYYLEEGNSDLPKLVLTRIRSLLE